MFAYILAATHLGLRHAVTSEIQVCSTRPKLLGQAWHMGPRRAGPPRGVVEGLDLQYHYRPGVPTGGATPPVLHYCTKASAHGPVRQAAEVPRTAVFPPDCAGPLEEYPYSNERLLEAQRNTSEALKTRISAFMLRAVASSVWEAWSTTSSWPAAMTEAAGGGTGCRFAVLVEAT